MRRLVVFIMLMLAVFGAVMDAQAAPPLPKPKLMAVYFWASWCPSCKVLSPLLEQARREGTLDMKEVLFVTLDLSDKATIHQTILLASALGIAPYVQQQGSSTGYMALLSADSNTELARFDRASSVAAIVEGITQHLSAARPQ